MARKKEAEIHQENMKLHDVITRAVKDAKTEYSHAAAIEDPAQQIILLQGLKEKIYDDIRNIDMQIHELAKQRAKEGAKRTARTYAQRAGIILGYATVVGGVFLAMDVAIGGPRIFPWTSKKSEMKLKAQEEKKIYTLLDIDTHKESLWASYDSAEKLQIDLIKNAPLKSVSNSPDFETVLRQYSTLRDRFTAAGIDSVKDTPKPEQEQAAEKSAPQKRQRESYKRLIKPLS